MTKQEVDLHLDPACPWCWLTALWLFEVERVRPVTVTSRLFSLAEVNRGADTKRDSHNAGERALRVLVGARRVGAETGLRAVYLALGEAYHEQNQPLGELATLRGSVVAAGLDERLADAALDDDTTLSELLSDHAAAVALGAFGVPTMSVNGSPLVFGPIVDTRIGGEEAGKLWDVVAPVLVHPRLFEMKRTRTAEADVGRHRQALLAGG